MGMSIRDIIGEIEAFVAVWERRAAAGRKAIELLRDSKFGPVGQSVPVKLQDPEKPVMVTLPTKEPDPAGRKKRTGARGKSPSSSFTGVSMLQGKWRAQYWNRQTKKSEHLGSFDDELLAAAAWFERDGDKAEAARLLALAGGEKSPGQQDPAKAGGSVISSTDGDDKEPDRFKGVYPVKKGGVTKYKASFWSSKKKKHIYLGLFDSPFDAAAAYQDHIGEHAEAKMLRAMGAEQQQNNPDKPLDFEDKRKLKTAGAGCIWVCKRCGLEYKSKGTCAHCGYDDMRKVPMEN